MWIEDEDNKLVNLPTDIVKQILRGVMPCELKGLSISVLENIRTRQLSIIDVLLLTGLTIEQARDVKKNIGNNTFRLKVNRV